MSRETAQVLHGILGAMEAFVAWVVRTALPVACEKVRHAYVIAAAACRVAWRRARGPRGVTIRKVVALNEDDGSLTDRIAPAAFDAENWEESVRVATGWFRAPIRVEVRYEFNDRKYRLVLRPGDTCSFLTPPERHRGGPKGVMAAELVGDEVVVDVTRRAHKYQGPARDFHANMGLRVAVTDMFPYDDTEELRHGFHTLRVVDPHGRYKHIPMECSDINAAMAETDKRD